MKILAAIVSALIVALITWVASILIKLKVSSTKHESEIAEIKEDIRNLKKDKVDYNEYNPVVKAIFTSISEIKEDVKFLVRRELNKQTKNNE